MFYVISTVGEDGTQRFLVCGESGVVFISKDYKPALFENKEEALATVKYMDDCDGWGLLGVDRSEVSINRVSILFTEDTKLGDITQKDLCLRQFRYGRNFENIS